ncbi:MAG: ABC transporter substrate-binding protein, partial [Candidatus Thorarchaeota archaeon]
MNGRRKQRVTIIVIIISFSLLIQIQPMNVEGKEFSFSIKGMILPYNSLTMDYMCLLKDQLSKIGIFVDIIEYNPWGWQITFPDNYDMYLARLRGGGLDPDFTGVYDENGSLNRSGYHTSMDWNETLGTGTNEWYIKQGTQIMPPDGEERIQHYWNWEQYMMDKILPIQPTLVEQSYQAIWKNLENFNAAEGLIQSWGKMQWIGTHQNQKAFNEVNIGDEAWKNLNPLFSNQNSEEFIVNAILDPLVWYDADLSTWPHLAESYTMINDTHIRINLRKGVKWQEDPDGLFPNEYLDAQDVYFTYFALKNISNYPNLYRWLIDMEIVDDDTIDLFIDGNPNTATKELYVNLIESLNVGILPEHYLNQTQLSDGITPDISHDSWSVFKSHPFGTGLFEFNENNGEETILGVFSDCWYLNQSITNDSNLEWERRFGDFSNGMEKLRIKTLDTQELEIQFFEKGYLDIVNIPNDVYVLNQFFTSPNFNIQSISNRELQYFVYNMHQWRNTPISSCEPCPNDPNITIGLAVRKAISYAMNRAEMNTVIFGGKAIINDYPIYPRFGIWCNPNIIRYNHDLEKARYYMNLAGYG